MKGIVSMLLLFSHVLIQPSCKKETDAELLAEKLQNVIKTEKVERVLAERSPIDPANTMIFGDWGKNYSFDPPFVTINRKTYSLTSLKYYEVATVSTFKCLILYF
jgi:hypothetical protein